MRLCGTLAGWVFAVLAISFRAVAVTLVTDDGLQVTFSDVTGGVTAVSVEGTDLPLIQGQWGGLAVKIGQRMSPAHLLQLDFATAGGTWTSARNENWNSGAYATWQPDGGIDDSAHLLLGNGSTAGAGMALAAPMPVMGGARLRISWQARVGDTATLQILCVRVYDAAGTDITVSTPAPSGWFYSGTSRAHVVAGIQSRSANAWQAFEHFYMVPAIAASVRVSLRYWNGGDGWVHVDDLSLDVVGGIVWDAVVPVSGPIQPTSTGFTLAANVPGTELHVETVAAVSGGKIDFQITLQDSATPAEDRPVQVYWILPVSAEGWQWWDDLDTARTIAPGTVYSNTHSIAAHAVGWHPYTAVSSAEFGLALAVPMSEPLVQRFECDALSGIYSLWEIGLSPVTTKLGPGRASFSCSLYAMDAAWGFRSATARYHALYPQFFVKRTTAEGCWEWPVHPSQVPDPLDFGWAYHEAYPIDDAAERDLCRQLGIGIYHYVEPWLFWDSWGIVTAKPSYEERVARITSWAAAPAGYVDWRASGGLDDSGHLLVGDGGTVGAGMATPPVAVPGGRALRLSWQAKVADPATLQILGVRVYDSAGADITAITPPPAGFGYSSTSKCHYVAGIANIAADAWQPFTYDYTVTPAAVSVRVSVRHWNGGDHWVHIDDFKIQNADTGMVFVDWDFEADGGGWMSALNDDWENPENLWKRENRDISAQAVINSSPLDADGRYLIDGSTYICQLRDSGSYAQGWPVNSDPDLPAPNTYELQLDKWVRYRLDEADGLYIDSVNTGSGLGDWENRRPDHLAVSDSPLTFSWADGGAAQLAPQAHEEFLQPVADELHAQGKLIMLNLFPEAARFHAHHGDVQGSETVHLVENATISRVRRALAGRRVVTNLLQYNWDVLPYASSAEVEEYIRGQLFWGFFPGISSIGGPMTGGAPDRYFLHPELYERDRPLFRHYIPVIRRLGAAGWEPIQYAHCSPAAEIERFGDFTRGLVYLTVRGPDRAAYAGEVSLNLVGCNLPKPAMPVRVTNVFTGEDRPAARADRFLTVELSIDAGDLRVLCFEAVSVAPDLDADGDVDAADFAIFESCASGPAIPHSGTAACAQADLDVDADVDLADFAILQRCYSGADNPADPHCVH